MLRKKETKIQGAPVKPKMLVGLDPSMTSFGFATLRAVADGKVTTQAFTTTTKDGSDISRILYQYDQVTAAIRNLDNLEMVAIEDYGPIGRTAGKITQRAELVGMIKLFILRELRLPIITITPTQLKLYATGNHRAKKEEVMQNCAREGHIARVSDEADAYFLAKFARLVYTTAIIGKSKVGFSYATLRPQ